MSIGASYPVKVEAHLDDHLSRWLWLVKWFLAIPHYFVLAFLWVAFFVMSIAAFFAILFTGRYPRGIFGFNVGVMRWTWRVQYYTYGALATDRYPPFTLAEVSDYPAHLEIAYPERLSRGLVLVKWWLLAIPHYIIVGILAGGTVMAWRGDELTGAWPGLIAVLAVIAGVLLAATGKYPMGVYDLVLGLNRWVLRVAAYAGLMTDEYPPFRLDMGGHEPGSTLTVPPGPTAPTAPGGTSGTATGTAGWTGGKITAAVIGSLMGLMSLGLLAGGAALLWADQTQREGRFVTANEGFTTSSHALVSEEIDFKVDEPEWLYPSDILGDALISVTPTDPTASTFVGIAPAEEAARYLDGVSYATIGDFPGSDVRHHDGGVPAARPGDESFWAASTAGEGEQSLIWEIREGEWTVVVMNENAEEGIDVAATVGAEVPALPWIAGGLLFVGGLFLLLGVALVGGAAAKASRKNPPPAGDASAA